MRRRSRSPPPWKISCVAKRATAQKTPSGNKLMQQPDTQKFHLRTFVERLVQQGECLVHDAPIDLIDIAPMLDGNPKAVWFRAVGPEKSEVVGNVMGAKSRLGMALDTDAAELPAAMRERLNTPIAPIEIPSSAAPVHEV